MTNPYEMFKTDSDLERKGIKIDYGSFWFRVARAGGENERFNKALKQLFTPYRRAIETESMDGKLADKLTTEAFLDTVLLGWGSEQYGDGKIPDKTGAPLEFSKDNARILFSDLPELQRDLMTQASRYQLFRQVIIEDDAKN